jgi:hypothetical protein
MMHNLGQAIEMVMVEFMKMGDKQGQQRRRRFFGELLHEPLSGPLSNASASPILTQAGGRLDFVWVSQTKVLLICYGDADKCLILRNREETLEQIVNAPSHFERHVHRVQRDSSRDNRNRRSRQPRGTLE